jgi:cytochrome c-type biogenesis protein CcmH/NrfF
MLNDKIKTDIERLKKQGKTVEQIADYIFDKYGLFEHVTMHLMLFATN